MELRYIYCSFLYHLQFQLTDVKLGGNYGNCTEDPDGNYTQNMFEEHYNVKYSLHACYYTCYQKYLTETCGCADPMYPMSGQALGDFAGESCKNRDLNEGDSLFA